MGGHNLILQTWTYEKNIAESEKSVKEETSASVFLLTALKWLKKTGTEWCW